MAISTQSKSSAYGFINDQSGLTDPFKVGNNWGTPYKPPTSTISQPASTAAPVTKTSSLAPVKPPSSLGVSSPTTVTQPQANPSSNYSSGFQKLLAEQAAGNKGYLDDNGNYVAGEKLDIKQKAGNGYYDSTGNFIEGSFDDSGNFTSAQNKLSEYYKKYGVEETKAPTLPESNNTIAEYGLTQEAIQQNLDQEKAAIKAKYDVLRREAEQKTESEKMSNTAGLYSLGEVNPLSSGVGSIAGASGDVLNKRKDALAAMEAEEVSNATNAAFGRSTTAQNAARTAQQDQEQKIKDQYTMEQTNRENNINAVKSAMAIVSSGKALEQADKENAWTGISNLLTTFGTEAFNGADAEILAQMEKAAGIPSGTLSKGLQTLKEQELTGKKTEIIKGEDGSIYSYVVGSNGEGEFKKLISSTSSGAKLTPAQINTTVNSIAGAFDNEPIVKNYNTALEGFNTIQSIGVETKSPADDIAFIYAFAKIMDPNSVVREGEYNTIQRYAQTWADTFGFTAKRIFSNTNFLSSDAKQKMINALSPKINTLTNQYSNLQSEYQRQIDDAYSGKPRTITNYSVGNSPAVSDVSSSDWANLDNL